MVRCRCRDPFHLPSRPHPSLSFFLFCLEGNILIHSSPFPSTLLPSFFSSVGEKVDGGTLLSRSSTSSSSSSDFFLYAPFTVLFSYLSFLEGSPNLEAEENNMKSHGEKNVSIQTVEKWKFLSKHLGTQLIPVKQGAE